MSRQTLPVNSSDVRRAFKAALVPFLLSRLGVLVVGLLAAIAIGYTPGPGQPSAWSISSDPVRNLLARWDTFWYLDIASGGYHWNGNADEQQNVVFFPLYPLLMRAGGLLIGGHPVLAGTMISLIAFYAALVYLWRLARGEQGPEVADGTIALLCAFPFAVFFSAVYTESLFLLAIVAAFFHGRRAQFGTAAAWGAAAGLLRPNGLLLSAPMAWLALTQPAPPGAPHPPRQSRQPWLRWIAVAAPPAGAVFYSIYLELTFGQGLAWVAGQRAWQTIAPWAIPGGLAGFDLTYSRALVAVGVVLAVSLIWRHLSKAAPSCSRRHGATRWIAVAIPLVFVLLYLIPLRFLVDQAMTDPWTVVVHAGNVAAIAFALAGLLPVTRLLGTAYGVFVALNLVTPIAQHGIVSLGRFTSLMFPLFIWLSVRTNRRGRWRWITGFAILQAGAAAIFFTWGPLV